MSTLTTGGRRLVRDLARRHGFGEEAVTHLLGAVAAGRGRMAQFSHPELGGTGQWMSGGLLMIGDMFDHALKHRVGALCTDLADALDTAASPDGPAASSSRSGSPGAESSGTSSHEPLFASPVSSSWWPRELGTPSATGSQGTTRYAYFADARRLVLDDGGDVRIHDTLDHRIGGFSQRQGGEGGLSMSSQHGTIDPATLPLVPDGRVGGQADGAERPADAVSESRSVGADTEPGDPVALIERLGALHERGVLTDEEFAAKKAELLARL